MFRDSYNPHCPGGQERKIKRKYMCFCNSLLVGGEIGRQLVKAPLAAAISRYQSIEDLTHPTHAYT